MIKNYFKIAWRNLWKSKTFSAINILGLALGMTCSLLIFLWVQDERNVDAFHTNSETLYTLYERQYYDGKIESGYYTPGVLAEEMKKVLPEVQFAANKGWNDYSTFSVGEKIIKQEGTWAGKDYFKMFTFPLLQGSKETALSSPESIAISKNMANNLFGSPENAINQTLRYENYKDFKVTAVFENIKKNSSMKFEYVLNWQFFLDTHAWANDFSNNGPQTYIKLHTNANLVEFENRIKNFLDSYNKDQSDSFRIELGLQRYDEMYLNSNFDNGVISGGRIEYVRLFSIVAIFILLIACINFMNLTTARSTKRAKEIGIRKVVGALRGSLIRQFITEAMLITFLAVIIALVLTIALLPIFNTLTGKSMQPPYEQASFWIGLIALTLITGFVSGSYPAFLLSSFKPIAVLKGKLKFGFGAIWFRKGLVVFQFVLSILLIAGMVVVSWQVDYIQTKNLGYVKNNLIFIPLEGDLVKKYSVFEDEANKISGITSISRVSQRPVEIENGTGGIDWDGKDPNTLSMFTYMAVDYNFVETMQLQILKGRDFSKEFATDSVGYIINESALAKIGYDNPIEKRLSQWGAEGKIIGLAKDFHFNSLRVPIEPLIIRFGKTNDYSYIIVRSEPGKTSQALSGLEVLYNKLNPKFPFSHQFADDEYASLYTSEKVIGKLSNYFAFLAIFISCLGLLGLVIFTAQQRTKEIGIRKVLGASIQSLFTLLSKDFLALIAVAFIIAIPVAFWATQNWLENFVYRAPINWFIVFSIAGIAVLIISLLTISYQAMKSAIANPVKSLRTE